MLPVYWLLRKPNLRLFVLMVFCLVFHAHFAGPAGVLPIVVLSAITYFVGRSANRTACVLAIAVCLAALIFYKYIHFFTQQLLHGVFWQAAEKFDATLVNVLPAAPPLAISFFTFEFVHYLYEVRRGHAPIKSFAEFAQFTFFFPSLVAGPIKRYEQFIPSLREGLSTIRSSDVAVGLLRVLVGFIKKSLVADNLTAYITQTDLHFAQLSISDRWLLLGAIALRIYMDFSGYTDMAIGLAQMLGIRLPLNFNWPYLAKNIQDFWQRWHISLSTWIRDYVYIPLGGNRLGPVRRIVNGLLAFALCGLWHGAAWNFVFWGLYHGVGLAVCSSYRKALGPVGRSVGALFDRFLMVSWAVTMLYVGIGWLLFFYPLETALQMTRLLFTRA